MDEGDEGRGALVGGLWVPGVKGDFHKLFPLAFYLIKRLIQRTHDLLLSFRALQVLLEVQMKILTAIIRQLPSVVSVEDCRVVAGEAASELTAAQAIVVWLIRGPLQSLNSMPDLVSQDAGAGASRGGFCFFALLGC